MLLLMIGFSNAAHALLPIRWVLFWPIEVAFLMSYLVPKLIFEQPLARELILQVIILLFIMTASAVGMRSGERQDRRVFYQLKQEKVMRFQAEHRLEIMS